MKLTRVLATLLSCTLLSTAAMADQPLSQRALSVEQEAIWNIAPQAPATITPTIRFDRPSPVYTVGEVVKFAVTVDQPAYVIVLNTAPDGRVTQLYPVGNRPNTLVQPGMLLEIPGEGLVVQANEPAGRETLTVFASNAPVSLDEFFKYSSGQFRSTDPGVARSLARKLEIVAATPAPALAPSPVPIALAPAASAPVPNVTTPAQTPSMVPATQTISYGIAKVTLDTVSQAPAVATPVVVYTPTVIGTPAPIVPTAPVTVTPSNAFTLAINVDKSTYHVGEPVRVNVAASRPCYLSILSYSSTGRGGKVFPSYAGQDTRIPANTPVSLPGAGSTAFLTALNSGQERLVALCSETSRELVSSPTTYAAFASATSGSERDLALVYGTPVARPSVAQAETFFSVY